MFRKTILIAAFAALALVQTKSVHAQSPAIERRISLWEKTGPDRCTKGDNGTAICVMPSLPNHAQVLQSVDDTAKANPKAACAKIAMRGFKLINARAKDDGFFETVLTCDFRKT